MADNQHRVVAVPLVSQGDRPSARGGASLTQMGGGDVYLIGGANREGQCFGDVHRLDLATQRWQHVTAASSSATELPPRSGHAAVALDESHIMVVGGLDSTRGVVYDDVHVLATQTRVWHHPRMHHEVTEQAPPSAPRGRNAHAAVLLPSLDPGPMSQRVHHHRVLIHGGSSPQEGTMDDLYILHVVIKEEAEEEGEEQEGRKIDQEQVTITARWERVDGEAVAGEPLCRELHVGVVLSPTLLAFVGGRDREGIVCSDMALLELNDPSQWRWHRICPAARVPRCAHALALVDGMLLGFAGWDGEAITGEPWTWRVHVLGEEEERVEGGGETRWSTLSASSWLKGELHVVETAAGGKTQRFGHCGCTVELTASVCAAVGVTGNASFSAKSTVEVVEEEKKARCSRPSGLLVFGGMNATQDLDDLVLVYQE